MLSFQIDCDGFSVFQPHLQGISREPESHDASLDQIENVQNHSTVAAMPLPQQKHHNLEQDLAEKSTNAEAMGILVSSMKYAQDEMNHLVQTPPKSSRKDQLSHYAG